MTARATLASGLRSLTTSAARIDLFQRHLLTHGGTIHRGASRPDLPDHWIVDIHHARGAGRSLDAAMTDWLREIARQDAIDKIMKRNAA